MKTPVHLINGFVVVSFIDDMCQTAGLWEEDAELLELSRMTGRPASYISLRYLPLFLLYLGISEHSLLQLS